MGVAEAQRRARRPLAVPRLAFNTLKHRRCPDGLRPPRRLFWAQPDV